MNFHVGNNIEDIVGNVKSIEEITVGIEDGIRSLMWHQIFYYDEAGRKTLQEDFDEKGNFYARTEFGYDESGIRVSCTSVCKEERYSYTQRYEVEDDGKSVFIFENEELICHEVYNERGAMVYYYDVYNDKSIEYKLDERNFAIEEIIRFGFRNPKNCSDFRYTFDFDKERGMSIRKKYNLDTGELICTSEYSEDETGKDYPMVYEDGRVEYLDMKLPLLARTDKDHRGNVILIFYIDYNGDPNQETKRIITYYE